MLKIYSICFWVTENAGYIPWLIKAAGPSQSWAQFLRVEYMTLKSFSPCRNNIFSSLADSSAMQPTRCSISSFLFLKYKNKHEEHLLQFWNIKDSLNNQMLSSLPIFCCYNFGSILLRGIAIAWKNLKPTVCCKHTQVNKDLHTENWAILIYEKE